MPRFLLIGVCWLTAAIAVGEGVKTAVIDMTAAFLAHPEAARAEAELTKKRAEAGKAFQEKANGLKKLLEEHQALTRSLIEAGEKASEGQKLRAREMLEQAAELEREVAAIRTTQERDLEQAHLAARRRVLAAISQAVEEYNSDGRYGLILDRSAQSANGIPQVVHAPGVEDITGAIVERLKKGK
jgi:Skp family chaperone for outer membrane proteins